MMLIIALTMTFTNATTPFKSKVCEYGREFNWKKCNEKTSSLSEYLFKQHHIQVEGVKDENGSTG